MVPPTLFVSGGIAVLQLCKEIYLKYQSVKRYRDDCKKLAHFVHRVEGFLMETEDEADMTGPGWQAAFTALHESLVEVSEVFDDCARFGIVRSLINADEINLRLSSIAQRMTMALQLIPIQKAKVTDRRLGELQQLQAEMRTAQFAAARAAEQQSAQLKRLMDQSRVDASKTQEMLAQVLQLLQADASSRTSAAAAAAGPGPAGGPAAAAAPAGNTAAAVVVSSDQLEAEVQDLKAEMVLAQRDKNVLEEQYLAQIIAAIEAMEVNAMEAQHGADASDTADQPSAVADQVPLDLLCPITKELLEDPVILIDSYQTYERAAIEEWLGRGNTKDPITGIQLSSATLVPNVLVRKLAREWLEAHPSHRKSAAAAAAAAATAAPQAAFAATAAPRGDGVSVSLQKAGLTNSDSGHDCTFSAQKAAAAIAGSIAGLQQTDGSSSSTGKTPCQLQLQQQNSSDDFSPNPKAVAVLAAAQSNVFDPAALFSKQQQLQRELGLDEKAAAQRAYAAAVAAAAAAEAESATDGDSHGQEVAVYSIFRSAAGGQRRGPPQEYGPSVHQPTVCDQPAAAAAATDQQQLIDNMGHVSLLEYQQQQQQGQQQQAVYGQPQQPRPQVLPVPVTSGNRSPLRSAGADRAGSPTDAGWLARDTVTLEDFRATFGRVAQSRTHLTMKHGTQIEKIVETQRAERARQLQQEIEKQELAGQISSYEARWRLQQLQQHQQQDDMQDRSRISDLQQQQLQQIMQHTPSLEQQQRAAQDLQGAQLQQSAQSIRPRHSYEHHHHQQQQQISQAQSGSLQYYGPELQQGPQQQQQQHRSLQLQSSIQQAPQQQQQYRSMRAQESFKQAPQQQQQSSQQAPYQQQQQQPQYSHQQQQLANQPSLGGVSHSSSSDGFSESSSITFKLPGRDGMLQPPPPLQQQQGQQQQQQQQDSARQVPAGVRHASFASSVDSAAPSLAHYAVQGAPRGAAACMVNSPNGQAGRPISHHLSGPSSSSVHAVAGAGPAYSPRGSQSLNGNSTDIAATRRSHERVHSMPAAAGQMFAGGGSAAPQYAGSTGNSPMTGSSTAAAAAAPRSGAGVSRWGFGRKKSSSSNKHDVAAADDAASISSDGSASTNASRRSVGKSVMGVLKNISYSVVYDDAKC